LPNRHRRTLVHIRLLSSRQNSSKRINWRHGSGQVCLLGNPLGI
jgi:hypothetical protein